jgi:phosphatidylserine decarboxylase
MRINREGYRIIFSTALLFAAVETALIVWALPWIAWAAGVALSALLCFVLRFFRDPRRATLTDPGIVYSPADGEIVICERVTENEYFKGERLQVSVFMSIWNVHVNWFPVGGRIAYFRHHQGKYLVAWHPKSSEKNERTTVVVDTTRGEVLFRQIAGYVARRIVSYAAEGRDASQNSRAGFIKFGSRVDLLLPLDAELLVKVGDKVTGSQTPIAGLK